MDHYRGPRQAPQRPTGLAVAVHRGRRPLLQPSSRHDRYRLGWVGTVRPDANENIALANPQVRELARAIAVELAPLIDSISRRPVKADVYLDTRRVISATEQAKRPYR